MIPYPDPRGTRRSQPITWATAAATSRSGAGAIPRRSPSSNWSSARSQSSGDHSPQLGMSVYGRPAGRPPYWKSATETAVTFTARSPSSTVDSQSPR